MYPCMDWHGVSGWVPGLHLLVQAREDHLVQNVVHDPGGKERHPALQEVNNGVTNTGGP